MKLTERQIKRYSRHIVLAGMGENGQQKILKSKVLVIGAGGLGSPILLYLAAAGVGTIGVADGDIVDLTNLQRQIIHFSGDVGRQKVRSAKKKISDINPQVDVITHLDFIDEDSILETIKGYDFVIDATDGFPAKFLINDACVISGKPYSHAGALGYNGQTFTVVPGESACLRCIFPDVPPADLVSTCSLEGVLSSLPGVIGTIQATETLKYITGVGKLLINRIMIFDALDTEFRKMVIKKNPDCPVCGKEPSIISLRNDN